MFRINPSIPVRRYLIPTLWLGILMIYMWIGHTQAPFHGDEADHLFKSHDFIIAVVQGHPEKLKVTPPVQIDSPEHIRLLTGTTTALFTGYTLWSAGYTSQEWPAPWYYAQDVAWNIKNGRLLRQDILNRGRVSTTLIGMLSIPLAFGIVWVIFSPDKGFRMLAALVAASLIATHPAWLLNSRRVMQEAALGTGSLAVVFSAMLYICHPKWWKLGLLILLGGLCLAAKSTGVVTIGSTWAALGLIVLHNGINWRQLLLLTVAGILVIAMYIVMTPAIWGSPFSRIKLAAELRADVLKGQAQASPDAYDTLADQWFALIKQPFLSDLQYFETSAFAGYLDDQIAEYENAHLDGWQMPTLIGIFSTVVAGIGLYTILLKWRRPEIMLLVFWVIGVGIAIGFAVPLAWQRYYLLWSLAVCLLVGIGFGRLLSGFEVIAQAMKQSILNLH